MNQTNTIPKLVQLVLESFCKKGQPRKKAILLLLLGALAWTVAHMPDDFLLEMGRENGFFHINLKTITIPSK